MTAGDWVQSGVKKDMLNASECIDGALEILVSADVNDERISH